MRLAILTIRTTSNAHLRYAHVVVPHALIAEAAGSHPAHSVTERTVEIVPRTTIGLGTMPVVDALEGKSIDSYVVLVDSRRVHVFIHRLGR